MFKIRFHSRRTQAGRDRFATGAAGFFFQQALMPQPPAARFLLPDIKGAPGLCISVSAGPKNCLPRLTMVGHFKGMTQIPSDTQTWPDIAISLYDKLTGRGAEITYEFQGLEISVPSSASSSAQHATWRVNGTMKIRTKDETTPARA